MTTTDIRKGDLVKATLRDEPEYSVTGRVKSVGDAYAEIGRSYLHRGSYDFEVLERPIEEELVKGAVEAYRDNKGCDHSIYNNESAIEAVIEFVREYDAKKAGA